MIASQRAALVAEGRALLLALFAAATLACFGCGSETSDAPEPAPAPPPIPDRPSVLLLGIDGADWDVIDPLVAGGYLPELGRLVASGVRADLDCVPAMPATACFCPPVWVSIVTGVGQDIHRISGIHDGVDQRGAAALWELLPRHERSSTVVSFRNTWPPEKSIRFVLTEYGLDFAASKIFRMWPERLQRRVQQRKFHTRPKGLFETLGMLPAEGERDPVPAIIARDRVSMEALLRLRAKERTDLTVVLLHSPDKAEHLKWASIQPERGDPIDTAALLAQAEAWQGPIVAEPNDHREDVASQYLEIDAWLARLFAVAPFDYVLVASDHGMTRDPDPEALPGGHGPGLSEAHLGVFALRGPGVRAGVELAERSVFDVAPTLAYLLGVPIAEDLPGALVAEAFEPGVLEARPPQRIAGWKRARKSGS